MNTEPKIIISVLVFVCVLLGAMTVNQGKHISYLEDDIDHHIKELEYLRANLTECYSEVQKLLDVEYKYDSLLLKVNNTKSFSYSKFFVSLSIVSLFVFVYYVFASRICELKQILREKTNHITYAEADLANHRERLSKLTTEHNACKASTNVSPL